MISQITNYIHENHELFFTQKNASVEILEIAGSPWRAYEHGRIHFLIILNGQVRFVARIYRSEKMNHILKKEVKIINSIHETFPANSPEPICTALIDGFLVTFETCVKGSSQKSQLLNLKQIPYETLTPLSDVVLDHFNTAKTLIEIQNKIAKRVPGSFEKKELMQLFAVYEKHSLLKKKDLEQIKNFLFQKNDFHNKGLYRIVHTDFVPKNIFTNKKDTYLIDFEFSYPSALWYVEPVRYVFSYLLELIDLGYINGTILDTMTALKSKRNSVFYNQANTFLKYFYGNDSYLTKKALIVTVILTLNTYRKVRDIIPHKEQEILEEIILLFIDRLEETSVQQGQILIPTNIHTDSRDILILKKQLLQKQKEIETISSSRGFKFVKLVHKVRTKTPLLKKL